MKKIFFIDEVGFNIWLRTKAYLSSKNTRPFHIVLGLRNRNISVCCVINKNGISDYKAQNKAFNSEKFYGFLSSLIHILHKKAIYSAVYIIDKVEQIKTLVFPKG